MNSSMPQSTQPSSKSTIFYGLVSVAIGLFYMLISAGVIPMSGKPADQSPHWLAFCLGLAFFGGGLAVVIQTLAGVSGDSVPAAIPVSVRYAMNALGLMITACLASVALWVGFGPGPRHFTSNVPFIRGRTGELIGRTAFGFGGVLISLVLIAVIIGGLMRLRRGAKS
jgi:hypothetical protein